MQVATFNIKVLNEQKFFQESSSYRDKQKTKAEERKVRFFLTPTKISGGAQNECVIH